MATQLLTVITIVNTRVAVVADTFQSELFPSLNAVLTLARNLCHLPGLLFFQYWNIETRLSATQG